MNHPDDCESIEEVRRPIDALDREMVALIGSRARYVGAAAHFKADERDVRDPEHQKAIIAERRRWAGENGLDPDVIEEVYRTPIPHFLDREMQRWRETV